MSHPEPQRPKLVWDAEATHPELIEPVKTKLREIIDPEIGLNVIELGLIRNLRIQDDQAEIEMMLTTPFCPYAPAMMEMTRQHAEAVLGRPVNVELSLELWDPSMMEEGAGAAWGFF